MRKKGIKLITIGYILAVVGVLSFAAGHFITASREEALPAAGSSAVNSPTGVQTPPAAAEETIPFLAASTGNTAAVSDPNKTWAERSFEIIIRLFVAVILAAVLAFRPRRDVPLLQRNLYVAQTQILLAVVAAALMMIVGDNTARAFAIFAAVSLVRFRTNIRDPKEITVLLISLALGLAAGVGRWDLGVFLCLFVLALLWVLEYNESEEVVRPMELTINTRDTEATQDILKRIFDKYGLEAEVRQLNPPDEEDPVGCIVYYLNLRLNVSTDRLSDRIMMLDSDHIEGLEWKSKKKGKSIYE